jgi:hypothetical protein
MEKGERLLLAAKVKFLKRWYEKKLGITENYWSNVKTLNQL